MSNHVDFYFDIISPYAFIAYKNIINFIENKKKDIKSQIIKSSIKTSVFITA